ncbi:hotdog fold thioesterase [Sulfoacidibacillus thermotolerans]|nr:hotdog fold thioesterase [Sulfoacidibacillus thermotolerans]
MTEKKRMTENTMIEWLGIELLTLEPELVIARMPVDHRTHQPAGMLHGGASVALAETVASVGSWYQIDQATQVAVGLEINANHIRSVHEGYVVATATPLHRGRTTHVWDIRIRDEQERLVCVSRCTVAIVPKQR